MEASSSTYDWTTRSRWRGFPSWSTRTSWYYLSYLNRIRRQNSEDKRPKLERFHLQDCVAIWPLLAVILPLRWALEGPDAALFRLTRQWHFPAFPFLATVQWGSVTFGSNYKEETKNLPIFHPCSFDSMFGCEYQGELASLVRIHDFLL